MNPEPMNILDGKKASDFFKAQIATEVALLKQQGKKVPHLAAILVGNDGASETYVGSKVKTCEQVGFKSSLFRFDNSVPKKRYSKK